MRIKAEEFNRMAERYYREELCRRHLDNGLDTLVDDALRLDGCSNNEISALKERLIGSTPAALFIRETGCRLLAEEATDHEIHILLLLTLTIIRRELHNNVVPQV